MTDRELEKLFLDFADAEEISQAKNKIKNTLLSPLPLRERAGVRGVVPAWKFLLPATAAAAALAAFIIFHTPAAKQQNDWKPKMEYVSVYDSPMYVYLINSRYEENGL